MLRPGDRLGPFAITGVLGAGAMGAVFSAIDERLRREVAIKVVLGAATGVAASRRLVREARIAASLDHPGLVRIHELGEQDGEIYVVMELVRGATLADILAECGPAPIEAVAAVGVAIARATAVAHAAGIVHRDLKPRNVVLRPDGVVKVLDFGLAKEVHSESARLTMSGAVSGTPAYLAPELLDGAPPNATTDVWSLGIMLSELASGSLPFDARSLPKLFLSIATTEPDLSGVPDGALSGAIARILAKSPAQRLGAMTEVAEVLAPLAKEEALLVWARPTLGRSAESLPGPRTTESPPPLVSGAEPPPPPELALTARPQAAPGLLPTARVQRKADPQPTRSMTPLGLWATVLADAPGTTPSAPETTPATKPQGTRRSPPSPPNEVTARVTASRSTTWERDEEVTARVTASRSSARALDEDRLDELAERITSLPEPVASLATSVEAARAEGDATGVRKRLFELGIGVVRHAIAFGLAVLAARLGRSSAPRPLADALRKAARLSDGQWCDLGRVLGSALKSLDPVASSALAFAAQKPLADLVAARNEFIHRGGAGNDALDVTLAVLDSAAALLAVAPRVVVALEPPAFEVRAGLPIRAGVWRKTRAPVGPAVEAGAAYLASRDGGEWTAATPWMPLVDKKLLLVDAPHAAGKSWRWLDPETGEHRESAPLDQALRRLLGADTNAPQELTDRPALVGRAPALQVIRRAAEEAATGGIRVVILTGPFGFGRSRLLETAADAAAGFGYGRVVRAACSLERRGPLRPLRRAFEGVPGLERACDAMDRASAIDPLATRDGQSALLEAVEEELVEASLEEATLVTIDDAQCADEQTLALLRLLTERATRGARGRLVIVAGVRDEPNPSLALRRFVGQVEQDVGSGATRVTLDPLGEADAQKLVKNVAPFEAAIERAVVKGAGGVPFFLVQPLLVWNETGALAWQNGAWHPARPGVLEAAPPGVGDLVQARLGSYFDPGSEAERAAQHVLACVALYGAGIPVDWLVVATESAGTSALAAEHALGALVEAGLLVVRGDRQEHGFAQAVVRQAVLDGMASRPWLRRVHRALLEAIAASDGAEAEAAFLARGYEHLGVKAEAAAWLPRAIAGALATASFEEAIELGEKLAKTGRDAAERARAELAVATAWLRSGHAKDAAARLARMRPPPGDRALDLEARVLALQIGAVQRDLPTHHDLGLVSDADALGDLALRIEARLAASAFRGGKEGLALAEEAASLAISSRSDLHYRALATRFERLEEFPDVPIATRRRVAEETRGIARELGSIWAELEAENNWGVSEFRAGETKAAIAVFEQVAARAAELRLRTLEREVGLNIARCHLRLEDYRAALGRADEVLASARGAGDTRLVGMAQALRADCLLGQGDLLSARQAIEEATDLVVAQGDYTATLALLRRADLRARTGAGPEAARDATLARDLAVAAGNADLTARAEIWLALDAAKSGAPEALERLREALGATAAAPTSWRGPTRRLISDAEALLARVARGDPSS